MGSLYKGTCYPTLEAARKEMCADYFVRDLEGSQLHTAECGNNGNWSGPMIICKRLNGQGCAFINSSWPITPDCTYEGGSKYATDWAAVFFIVLVVIWSGKSLIRLFDYHHEKE